jgi:hypothetical protein
MSDVSDTLTLSIRKAAAVTLKTVLANIGDVTYTAFSTRRRLTSGLSVSFSAVVVSTSTSALQTAATTAFTSSGATFAAMIVSYAAASGQTVSVKYEGVTVIATTLNTPPTPSPTVLAPGPIAGVVIASFVGAAAMTALAYAFVYQPSWLGLQSPNAPVPTEDPDATITTTNVESNPAQDSQQSSKLRILKSDVTKFM